jgi:hypothetical protein
MDFIVVDSDFAIKDPKSKAKDYGKKFFKERRGAFMPADLGCSHRREN